jgi:hypothetical protein
VLKADVEEQRHVTKVMLVLVFTCLFYVSVVVFYRDSMLVCGLSLVVTLLVRWMTWTPAVPPSWMSGVAIKVQGSLPGQLLLYCQLPQQVKKLI